MCFFVHIGGAMVLDTSTMFRAGDIQVHILFVGEPRWLQAKKSRDTDTARPCVGLMFSSCWLRQSHLFSYWSGLKSMLLTNTSLPIGPDNLICLPIGQD